MDKLTMKLFITGRTVRSDKAISNLQQILQKHTDGSFDLTIVDVLEHPQIAETEHILATPTLVKLSPFPPRRIIGDLSDHLQLFNALDIQFTDKSE